MTTEKTRTDGTTRSAVLLALALGVALAAFLVALAGTAREAEAASDQIVFASTSTTGKGVDNPTGDREIFKMNPDGSGVKQLTKNEVDDRNPTLSPNGKKIAYRSYGVQDSNPEGDSEIYIMNAKDGSGQKNLSNTGGGIDIYFPVEDESPHFSPDGQKIAYESYGKQSSNVEGDNEVYVMNALDGSGQKNLSNTGINVIDRSPDFSPDGQKIAYESGGAQTSNEEGDFEVYLVNALDGSGQKNLSNTGSSVSDSAPDFSPDGQKIAYQTYGNQTSNPEGEYEVYVMNALDGSDQKNLTNNGGPTNISYIDDRSPQFSTDGQKIAYQSYADETSNPEGDNDIYVMNAQDGSGKKNLSNNNGEDPYFDFSPDSQKIAYQTYGDETSNPEGDVEVYVMSALDGSGQKNLSNNGEHDFSPDWGGQAKTRR